MEAHIFFFHIVYFMANVGLLREITAFVKGIRVLLFAFL